MSLLRRELFPERAHFARGSGVGSCPPGEAKGKGKNKGKGKGQGDDAKSPTRKRCRGGDEELLQLDLKHKQRVLLQNIDSRMQMYVCHYYYFL